MWTSVAPGTPQAGAAELRPWPGGLQARSRDTAAGSLPLEKRCLACVGSCLKLTFQNTNYATDANSAQPVMRKLAAFPILSGP